MNDLTIVNIVMVTYNHELYVAKAIESILLQKTTFNYELIIGDDCSTDSTFSICNSFSNKYPKLIKVIRHPQNIGMIMNYSNLLQICNGKYIAFCEGDDFWIDPNKLQKQITFLEKNPDYSICFHNMNILERNTILRKQYSNSKNQQTVSSINDLSKGNYIFTASAVVRNIYNDKTRKYNPDLPVFDYVFFMHCAKYGKIKFFKKSMGVYRIHDGGIWSSKNHVENYTKWIRVIELMRDDFTQDVKVLLNKQIITAIRQIINSDNGVLAEENKRALEKKAFDLFPDCFEQEIKLNFVLRNTLESHHSIKILSKLLIKEVFVRLGFIKKPKNPQ